MSANYNTALLRQLQAPLLDALRREEEALSQLIENKIRAQDLNVSKEAHEVASGLNMIGRQAIARLARRIELAIEAVSQPDRRGWDHMQVQTVARPLFALVKAFSLHLQDMVVGGEDLHVRLWPLCVALSAAMEESPPAMEELFEIDPNFDDQKFNPRPVVFLQEVTAGAYERLVKAIGSVEVARNQEEMEAGLRKALEVFNQVYALRHRRAYQAYWLIVRGRISAGQLEPAKLLENRDEWLALLRDAGIQLRKFGEDHRRLNAERLAQALQPLLRPWPPEWSVAHPVLAEVDRRLGISAFWQAVEEIKKDSIDGAAAQFSSRQKELETLLMQLRMSWNKLVSATEEQRKLALSGFLRNLVVLIPKKEWFPGTFAHVLFDGLHGLGDALAPRLKVKEQPPIAESLAYEVAATILLTEEVVERRSRWTPELEARARSQASRLVLALENRVVELNSLPPLRWDSRWHERQVEKALRLALEEVSKQADVVETALSDLVRGEDVEEIYDRLDELQARCRLMGRVLLTLKHPVASRVVDGIKSQIELIVRDKKVPVAPLSIAMASLRRFLMAKRNGDAEADALLAPGVDTLFGEGEYARWLDEEGEIPESPTLVVPPPVPLAPPVYGVAPPLEGPSSASAENSPLANAPTRNLRQEILGEGAVDKPGDPDVVEVFLEETVAALSEIEIQRGILKGEPANEEAWAVLRRQFHTLKGSGRISGLVALGEVAWWMEERLNEAMATRERYGEALDGAIGQTADYLLSGYAKIQQGAPSVLVQASAIRSAIDAAIPAPVGGDAEGQDAQSAWDHQDHQDPLVPEAEPEEVWTSVSPAPSVQPPEEEEEPLSLEEGGFSGSPSFAGLDPEISQMIRADAEEHSNALEGALVRWEMGQGWDLETIHRSSHTLASLSETVGWKGLSSLSRAIERLAEYWLSTDVPEQDSTSNVKAKADWETGLSALAEGARAMIEGHDWPAFNPELVQRLIDIPGGLLLDENGEGEAVGDFGNKNQAPFLVDSQGFEEEAVGTTGESEGDVPLDERADEDVAEEAAEEAADEWTINLSDTPVQIMDAQPVESAALALEQPEVRVESESESAVELAPPVHVVQSEPLEAAPLAADDELTPLESDVLPEGGLELPVPQEEPRGALAPATEPTVGPAVEAEIKAEALDLTVAAPAPEETLTERERSWEKVFSAIDDIQGAFAKLSQALLELNEQDYRD